MIQSANDILEFEKKRHKDIITPCCNKNNKDGKFVTYKGLPKIYGYCHSCGITTLPKSNTDHQRRSVSNACYTHKKSNTKNPDKVKYIDFEAVKLSMERNTNNNLISYLITKYGERSVNKAVNMYYIGTSKKKGCIFWYTNQDGKVQKSKHIWYGANGKRTNYLKVPYQNDDGYKFCLFGEHLLNTKKPIILVESEKSAIICSIELPEYTWLAYSGINGLTEEKIKALSNREINIIPDISQNAIQQINKKGNTLDRYNVDWELIDFTDSNDDKTLKVKGIHNKDIADFLLNDKDEGLKDGNDNTENNNENSEISVDEEDDWETIYQLEKSKFTEVEKPVLPHVKEAQELKAFFDNTKLPKGRIKLDQACTILNVRNFINNHFITIKNANNRKLAKPFLDRLYRLKKIVQNDT